MARITTIGAAILLFMIPAPTALAGSQGGYQVNTDGGVVHVADGSRAHISGSGIMPTNGGAIATVRVQGATDGLYQFGEINEGNGLTTDCGTGYKGFMAERIHVGQSPICDKISGAWGSDQQFTVIRPAGGTDGCSADLNGSLVDGPFQLGFPDSGIAFAVAEYNGTPPDSYSFTWGPGTEQPWQWTYGSDLVWHTVGQSDGQKFNQNSFWTITNLPSPFTISK